MPTYAFDLDGVISSSPREAGDMISALHAAGYTVYIVTGTGMAEPDEGKYADKSEFLQALGISPDNFDQLVVMPQAAGQNHAQEKAQWCKTNKVDVLIDNDKAIAEAAISVVPLVLVPWATREGKKADAGRMAAYAREVRAKYTQAQVDALGAKGQALKDDDGEHYSYPIADLEDLKNAVKAVGRGAADHDKIRRWIMKRAKAMGQSSLIPDNWNADGSLKDSKSRWSHAHRKAHVSNETSDIDRVRKEVAAINERIEKRRRAGLWPQQNNGRQN